MLTLKMGKIKLFNPFSTPTCELCWRLVTEPLGWDIARVCAPVSGDAETTGVGQASSHDQGIVRAEVGSDFSSRRPTGQ
jgi:hypothetical protein